MAAQTNKPKRLPKELLDYKREVKKLPFKERVVAYFNCAPFTSDLDGEKMDIILSTFSKNETKEFNRLYLPIYNAIDRYGDRIRAINANRIIYTNYIESALRLRDSYNYTADFLNLALQKIGEAMEGTKETDTREKLTGALRILQGYRRVSISAPEISLNKERHLYEVPTEEEDKFLLGVINTLKGILSLLKCYLDSLKEFLEWVGTPELLSKEFSNMEEDLLLRHKNYNAIIRKTRDQNQDADKFPLFFARVKVAEEYLSIDYEALPRSVDIFGEKNLFANTYRRFFNY
jgi:hypothetical protein